MSTTTGAGTEAPPTTAASRSGAFGSLDWRRYIIYIGFVVVFAAFAVTLGDKCFLSTNNPLTIFR